MKTAILILTIVGMIICLLAIPYALIAGVWQFNPTDIDWFNTKLLISATIGFFVNLTIGYVTAKLD